MWQDCEYILPGTYVKTLIAEHGTYTWLFLSHEIPSQEQCPSGIDVVELRNASVERLELWH